jgi:hypothetical protein
MPIGKECRRFGNRYCGRSFSHSIWPLKSEMASAVIVDPRNVYRPDEMIAAGFKYENIGGPAERASGDSNSHRLAGSDPT